MDPSTSNDDHGIADQHVSKTRTPIPKLQVAIVLLIQFAEPITALVIYPFVVQFVRDTGITRGEEAKTGFYAGLLESAFFLAESLTVFHFGPPWRRPVLLLGPLGLTIAMLGFGLSKTFWCLFFFRCIQGVCNGNIGVSKTIINEIADPTNIADIFSMMPLMLSVATTVAPLIGGLLADPAKKWPDALGKIEILREHPYLLPCAVAASVALFSFVLALVGLHEVRVFLLNRDSIHLSILSQTLPSRRRKNTGPTETDPLLPAAPLEEHDAPPPVRDLLTRPILIALTNHGLLCLCHMANEALIPLFFATPMSLGGLGLNPHDIGLILGIFGVCNALVQAFFGGRVIRRFGPRRVFTAAFCALAGQFAMYPVVSFLAHRAGRVDTGVRLALAFQLSGTSVLYLAHATTMMFIMDAAPSRASLGSVNGLAQMVGTVLRSMAPSFSSSLFALSAEHQIAGGNFVYYVLIALTLVAARCTLFLPRKLRSSSEG
ncbi:major facilitator superfamily multidrug-resistance, DHA1 sub-family [Mycena vitilis]|nr:major facilitator superfamily multidrug-resistance, DHA1 sub-family [Mycena vitilis]